MSSPHLIQDDQIAAGGEILEVASRLALAALEHRAVRERFVPKEPASRAELSAEHSEAEKVVGPAAVNADHDHVGPFDQRIEASID